MISESEVRQLVAQTVHRILGSAPAPTPARTTLEQVPASHRVYPRLIYQEDVRTIAEGDELQITPGARLTPLAQELVLQRKIRVITKPPPSQPSPHTAVQTVAIGADHGGYTLKETLKGYLHELGYRVVDAGTNSTEAVDYPDFAYSVAKMVSEGLAWRGIMVDGAGIGSCMTANKVPGVRASLCYDISTAANAREHNDANVLTLGGTLIGINLAKQIVKTWLTTEFGGGRHARRVQKIVELEQRFLKK